MKLSAIFQTYKKRLLARTPSDVAQNIDPAIQHHLNHVIQRFRGAVSFMKKTTINLENTPVALKELPWFVLLGPANSGKTSLLAHANVPYILRKQFSPSMPGGMQPTEQVDWWVTRTTGIIDVPSKYAFADNSDIQQQSWDFFLSMLKKQGKKNISGIAITLPLPEIMRHNDIASLHNMLRTLTQRMDAMQTSLDKSLSCYLVITKCDLLAGFHEFFAEIPDDEITQHWGITLPQSNKTDQVEQLFETHFNELIRKLNQQLLSRLHQERDPMARPYIKNFPLQIERLKAFIIDSIKQLNSGSKPLLLQGVYLTSAVQTGAETAPVNNPAISRTQQALQLFKAPAPASRSYFIKQFLLHGLHPAPGFYGQAAATGKHRKYVLYAASASAIILAAAVLGRNFKIGMDQANQMHANLADYHHVLQQFHNPNESMIKTLTLLETLHKSKKDEEHKNIVSKILNYYSDQSQKNAAVVYRNALQAFLMPEIKNYFADYLDNPINKDAESIYGVFKAYLMLGDMQHFDGSYIRTVLIGILPKTFSHKKELVYHFDAALNDYQPIQLDGATVNDTRKYLLSLRGSQLGDIILRNMDSNTQTSDALLGDNVKTNALFTSKNASHYIPVMYTGKNFVNVFEQEIQLAAIEAATGNWILGTDFRLNANPNYTSELAEEMRTDYVKNYVDTWESALANIKIEVPRDLEQADAIIVSMTSYDSPLLRVLTNIHENTFFEPVTSASPKLFSIGQLIDRNNTSKTELFQILTHLEALHEYLQPVLSAEDPKKAAYLLINNRMQHQGEPDPITKLRLAAEQSPMPLKGWINQLTNDTWHFLLRDGMHYLDTSWNEKVSQRFEATIAHRYRFNGKQNPFTAMNLNQFNLPGQLTRTQA